MNILFWAHSPCIRTYKEARALKALGVGTMLAWSGKALDRRYPGLRVEDAFDDAIDQASAHKWQERIMDVVHVAHPPAEAVNEVQFLNLPIVYDCHDLESVVRSGLGLGNILTKTMIKVERDAITNADGLVVVTEDMERYIKEEYAPQCPVAVIPNAGFPGLDVQSIPKLSRRDNCLHLVYSAAKPHWGDGHFRDLKWVWQDIADQYAVKLHVHALMLDDEAKMAFERHSEHIVLEMGNGPMELVAKLGQYDIGIIPHVSSDLEVMKHLHMSSPNKAYEYWQAGLPMLATPLLETGKLLRRTGIGIEVNDYKDVRSKSQLCKIRRPMSSDNADMKWYAGDLIKLYEKMVRTNGC